MKHALLPFVTLIFSVACVDEAPRVTVFPTQSAGVADVAVPTPTADPYGRVGDAGQPTPRATLPGGQEEIVPSALVGTWLGPCSKDLVVSQLSRTLAANGEFQVTETLFEGDCVEFDARSVSSRRGILKVTGQGPTQGSFKTEFTHQSVLLTAIGSDNVRSYNFDKWCGISDWVTGVAREVTGAPCAKVGEHPIRQGEIEYDIVSPQGGLLLFGKRTPENTGFGGESRRPIEFDSTKPFRKK